MGEVMSSEPVRIPDLGFRAIEEQDTYNFRRNMIFTTAAIAGPILGLTIGNMAARDGENANNAKDLRIAAGYEQCVNFIETELQPGDTTIRLSELSKQQQDNCGVSPPDYVKGSEERFDEEALPAPKSGDTIITTFNVVGTDVTLPSADEYKAAAADRKERADYAYVKVGLETATIGLIGFMGGLVVTGGLANLDLRRRRRAAIARMSKTT